MSKRFGDRVRLGELIAFLRWLSGGWSQARLGRKSRLDESQISRYEAGTDPRPANLNRILSAFGVSLWKLDYFRWSLRVLRRLLRSVGPSEGIGRLAPPDLDLEAEPARPDLQEALDRALTVARLELALIDGGPPASGVIAPSEADHRRVDALWEWLKPMPDSRRRLFLRGTRTFEERLLAVRIRKAGKEAAGRPAEAQELARLALFADEQLAESPYFPNRA